MGERRHLVRGRRAPAHGPGGKRFHNHRSAPAGAALNGALAFPDADNGSNGYVSGAPDERWNSDARVAELRQARGREFEVVRKDGLVSGG